MLKIGKERPIIKLINLKLPLVLELKGKQKTKEKK